MNETPTPRLNKRQQQAQARRAQILEAALQLFASQGFAATSTKQIAQRAGTTEGLLYHYFPSKAGIMQALAQRRNEFALNVLLNAEAPAYILLPEMATQVLLQMHQEAELLTMMLGEAQTNPEINQTGQVMMEGMITGFSAYLQQRIDAGELRSDLPIEVSVHGFFGAFLVFFFRQRHLPAAEWAEAARAFAHAWVSAWYHGARRPEG